MLFIRKNKRLKNNTTSCKVFYWVKKLCDAYLNPIIFHQFNQIQVYEGNINGQLSRVSSTQYDPNSSLCIW